jgi:hypothetical protein
MIERDEVDIGGKMPAGPITRMTCCRQMSMPEAGLPVHRKGVASISYRSSMRRFLHPRQNMVADRADAGLGDVGKRSSQSMYVNRGTFAQSVQAQ